MLYLPYVLCLKFSKMMQQSVNSHNLNITRVVQNLNIIVAAKLFDEVCIFAIASPTTQQSC